MKTRNGFVSNSSSSSFIIKNTSKQVKTIVDFVIENPQLLTEYNNKYNANYKLWHLVQGAEEEYDYIFNPKEEKECIFGDSQGNTLGAVYDYILRDGGKSKNFTWKFNKPLR